MKIQFESSTYCNANCTFCANKNITRPQGEMSDELFHKIIQEGKVLRRPFFVPFLNGEPFVFNRIWEWLDYMQDEKVAVHLYTNGEFMDVDRILSYSNIRLVCCSINAATKGTYDKIVRGPDFDKVVSNTEELIKKGRMQTWASMVIVEANKHEVGDFKKKWGRKAIFGEYKNWTGDLHDPIEKIGTRVPCYPVINTINILWDGRVVPCCMDYDGKLILGDVNKNTLTQIWHSSKWIRDKHRSLDFDFEPCKRCNHNT